MRLIEVERPRGSILGIAGSPRGTMVRDCPANGGSSGIPGRIGWSIGGSRGANSGSQLAGTREEMRKTACNPGRQLYFRDHEWIVDHRSGPRFGDGGLRLGARHPRRDPADPHLGGRADGIPVLCGRRAAHESGESCLGSRPRWSPGHPGWRSRPGGRPASPWRPHRSRTRMGPRAASGLATGREWCLTDGLHSFAGPVVLRRCRRRPLSEGSRTCFGPAPKVACRVRW